MKIGVLSDTHLLFRDSRLERIVADYFCDVDVILHAGDIVSEAVLEAFDGKDVIAVCGNMDPPSLRQTLPSKRIVEVGDHRIGLIHGWGSPVGIEKRVLAEFEQIDCLVFGHTHEAQAGEMDGVYLFNSGSPTERRYARSTTIGILETGETIEGTIIPVEFDRKC